MYVELFSIKTSYFFWKLTIVFWGNNLSKVINYHHYIRQTLKKKKNHYYIQMKDMAI